MWQPSLQSVCLQWQWKVGESNSQKDDDTAAKWQGNSSWGVEQVSSWEAYLYILRKK